MPHLLALSLVTAALLLLMQLATVSAAPFDGVLYGKKYNKTSCPAMALPDSETAPTLTFIGSSLQNRKRKGQAAVFSFILAHREIETPHCDDMEVPNACCDVNAAHFVSVTLQLDPTRCATRKALKGLKIRVDGRIVPRRHMTMEPKAGTVTIKRLPPVAVPDGEVGYDHTLQIIVPQDTACTAPAFQGLGDAWPCAEDGCGYLAVTSVDAGAGPKGKQVWGANKDNNKARPARYHYPRLNRTEEGCCVSVGSSKVNGGINAGMAAPFAATTWCEGATAKENWDVRILAVGDWGAYPEEKHEFENQKRVAKGMAEVANDCGFDRIINVGDNFYESGLISGQKVPARFKNQEAKERFQKSWRDVYHGAHASLQNLVWYGTYGNHDIGMYMGWYWDILRVCFASPGQTWTHQQCLNEVDCCSSPLWQTTSVVNDPQWVLEGGEYSTKVDRPGAFPGEPPLLEFFFLDSNPYHESYFTQWYKYEPNVPGGLNEWRAVRNQTKADFLARIQGSDAIWKIPVIHASLASYAKHCGFDKHRDQSPDDPTTNSLDKGDCKYFVDLRRDLLNMDIELTVHGHDHAQQFVRLPAGYDGTMGSKPMHVLTTGAGCKQSPVAPGPADIQIWPRNACGGGTPCQSETSCDKNNACASWLPVLGWQLNRKSANVGFASLHANSTALLVRVFESVPTPVGPGRAPEYKLTEVTTHMITKT